MPPILSFSQMRALVLNHNLSAEEALHWVQSWSLSQPPSSIVSHDAISLWQDWLLNPTLPLLFLESPLLAQEMERMGKWIGSKLSPSHRLCPEIGCFRPCLDSHDRMSLCRVHSDLSKIYFFS